MADQYVKGLAITNQHPLKLIGDLFIFNFTPNYYIAFSLPISGPILIIAIILLILAIITAIIWLAIKKNSSSLEPLLLTFILFGAISNIVDRLRFGFVVDYLELKYFTVFNIADVMISLGAIILIIYNLKHKSLCSKETVQ